MMLDNLRNGEIVFSNIRLNTNYIPNPDNYYFMDGNNMDAFVDILSMCAVFATKVSLHNAEAIKRNTYFFPRYQRPKFNIYFDESGIFANSKDWSALHKEY
jgi:hypothetical protein